MTTKQCSNCAHAMVSQSNDQKFCIAHAPIPVITDRGVSSFFPTVMNWCKCDEFVAGEPQPESVAPEPIGDE